MESFEWEGRYGGLVWALPSVVDKMWQTQLKELLFCFYYLSNNDNFIIIVIIIIIIVYQNLYYDYYLSNKTMENVIFPVSVLLVNFLVLSSSWKMCGHILRIKACTTFLNKLLGDWKINIEAAL